MHSYQLGFTATQIRQRDKIYGFSFAFEEREAYGNQAMFSHNYDEQASLHVRNYMLTNICFQEHSCMRTMI